MAFNWLSPDSILSWISKMWLFGRKEGTYAIEIPYTEVKGWRWPNFTPKEIACKGSGLIYIDPPSMDALQRFRDAVGVPVIINSAYRSESHNKAVGGAPNSFHRKGKAFDIRITSSLPRALIHEAAKKVGFMGFGDYDTFVHIDTGPPRYWDDRKKEK